jgi:hypothetical protein
MKRPPAEPPMLLPYLLRDRFPRSGGWILGWGDLFCDNEGHTWLYDENTRVFNSFFGAFFYAMINLFIVGFPRKNIR